ncbi:MAG: DUF3822 family protein [Agriterribacter sp.]
MCRYRPTHVLYTVLHPESKEFIALQYFSLDKYNAFNQCKDIFYHNNWLSKSYRNIIVSYNFAGSLLIPEASYHQEANADLLNMIYGDLNAGQTLAFHLPDWQVWNVYRVPVALHQLLTEIYPGAAFFHFNTFMLKGKQKQEPEVGKDVISLVFYSSNLVCLLLQDGKLQLLKTFEYETAEDVNYHLLNMCRQLNVDCEKAIMDVSGFIDDRSSVYTGLEKYFRHITLSNRPSGFQYDEAFNEYPQHFFTSLFNTALCE